MCGRLNGQSLTKCYRGESEGSVIEPRSLDYAQLTGFMIMSFAAILLAANLSFVSPETGAVEALLDDLREHPALSAYESDASAAHNNAAGQMGLPNPRVSVGVNNVPVTDPLQFDEFLPSNRSVTFSQEIPSRGLRGARSDRERAGAEIAHARRTAHYDLLASELLVSLAELRTADEIIALIAAQLEILDELEATLEGEVDAGRPVFADLSDVDADRAEADERLAEAESMRAQAMSRIHRLVGPLEGTAPMIEAIEPPSEPAQAGFHSVRVAQALARAADAGVAVRERDYDISYGVSVSYLQREDGANFAGDDWVSVQLGLSIPLWSRWNQTPRLEAARDGASAARLRIADASRTAGDAFRAAAAEHAAAVRAASSLERRDRALDGVAAAAQRQYESAAGPISPVLDARINQIDVRISRHLQRLAADRAAARMSSLIAGTE